jgi:hypothetical protein
MPQQAFDAASTPYICCKMQRCSFGDSIKQIQLYRAKKACTNSINHNRDRPSYEVNLGVIDDPADRKQ